MDGRVLSDYMSISVNEFKMSLRANGFSNAEMLHLIILIHPLSFSQDRHGYAPKL
jgi:hypothetical protein